jgi:SPP1 gp7 family putative phage head morphogenesis protein
MATFLTAPSPHEEAVARIADKPVVTRRVFDELLPEFQARAFVVSGVECASTLQRVRDLAAKLPAGGDWDELKAGILDEISPWLITSTDPEERAKQESAARRRAELILRQNGWQAYAVTNYREMEEQKDVFPFRQYLSSEDSRVRATHAALNRKIFPADHPFWHNHTPPWEFGCRCDVVPMMADEVDEIRGTEAKKAPEDRQVIEGPMLEEIERGNLVMPNGTGKLDIRTPREKTGKGYEFRPDTLALSYEDVLARYDAPVAEAFRAWAETTKLPDGRTVAQSLGGPSAAPAPAPGGQPAGVPRSVPSGTPVSQALDVRMRDKAAVRDALAAIDSVHGDGQLPTIPVTGSPDKGNLGHYASMGAQAVEVAVRASGPWPRLTAVHEVGHFLDHQAIGVAGRFTSTTAGAGELADVLAELRATPTFARIGMEAGPKAGYFQSPEELWARAYAQYVAEESQHPELLADLDRVANSLQPWRQWPADEFAPVRAAIRKLFLTLQWQTAPNP